MRRSVAAPAAAPAVLGLDGSMPPLMSPHASGTPVLIVDDKQDAAEMLSAYVESLGYRVGIAFDGPAALQAARELSPRIALLDLGLPVMDGASWRDGCGSFPAWARSS